MQMRIRILTGILLISLSPAVFPQEGYSVDWDYTGQPLEVFIREAESRHPVNFFYMDEWIGALVLGNYPGRTTISAILDTLFTGKDLYHYERPGGNIIFTRDYAVRLPGGKDSGDGIFVPGADDKQNGGVSISTGNLVVNIGNPSAANLTGNVTLSGLITNRDTKENVAGVTVQVPALTAGTISNAYGFYSISIPRGRHSLKFTFIGMRERVVDLNLYDSGELNIDMTSVLIPLKEAVITAEKDITLQRTGSGVEKISVSSFRLMPSAMGESDITKSLLLLPGVHTVGEGSAGLNVRGGSADQNLVLLYGAPLYNTSHFFGFFSAVNPDIIRDVTLYKGSIPAKYGGRLASVLEITPRDGDRSEFSGSAGISPVTAHFTAEGPIIDDTLFYMITGRRTYSNWILKLLEDPALRNSRAMFYDLNGRLAWDLGRKNKIDVSGYFSNDAFRLNSDTTYNYINSIASLRWRHYFNSRFFSSMTLSNSSYSYDISSLRVPEESFSLHHRINTTGLKAEFNWFRGRNEINFGTDISRHSVIPGDYLPADAASLVIPNSIQRQRALETAVWIEDNFTVTSTLSVSGGIRLGTFHAFGPQTVTTYSPGFPRNIATVADTLYFKGNRIYRNYAKPEFRLSANFRAGSSSSFKLSYNHTNQYLHLLTNTTAISPTDTWKLSDYHLEPQSADQFAAGFYKMLSRNRVEASAEIYYKKINNMIDFKGGTDLVMNEYLERDLVNVRGKAYGMELLVRKPEGRARWSAGYTWSKILLRNLTSFDEELINSGNWFPASFDRPHNLILTLNYIYSRRVSLSANYNYSSGRPVTYPVSTYSIGDVVLMHYSERNRYRLPYYSRLDISVRISGDLRLKKLANPHWIFSIYNVTGRKNVYSVFFRNEGGMVKGYYLSVFGRPIPSLSLNFDF